MNEADCKVREKVLADNTAQAIHKYLVKLFQEEMRFKRRWVWELLQNARDVSPPDGVKVCITHQENQLLFQHSGMPFTNESVAHLIYHGSTKGDPTTDPIGQFGTGFLTTHIISRVVRVRGITEDGSRFSFDLDRQGRDPTELLKAHDRSYEAFCSSRTANFAVQDSAYTTEFAYELTPDTSIIVKEGLRDLIDNASYLLAFNDKFRSLGLVLPDCCIDFEKTGNVEAGRLISKNIEERTQGFKPICRDVAVMRDAEVSVAVELHEIDDRWQVGVLKDTPRLFVAFPLTATRKFCLPLVVNSELFEPREDRDAPPLLEIRNATNINRVLIERALDLAVEMAKVAALEDWKDAPLLAAVGKLDEADWIDCNWVREVVSKRLIEPLRHSEILFTQKEVRVPPARAWIPALEKEELNVELWNLTSAVPEGFARLPRQVDACTWSSNMIEWARLLQKPIDSFDEAFTLQRLCDFVSKCGCLTEMERLLGRSTDAIDWLNRFHDLIEQSGHKDLFNENAIIPNQCGRFNTWSQLRRDPGIDDELKDFAERLGVPVRDKLTDLRMRLARLREMAARDKADILATVTGEFKKLMSAGSLDTSKRDIAARLFSWLVRNEYLDELNGFPVFTSNEDGRTVTLISDSKRSDDVPLAPRSCWPMEARPFADLFPSEHILSEEYFETLTDHEAWCCVASEGFVRLNPLYVTQKRVPFLPDEPFSGEMIHMTKSAVEVSDLAYFDRDGTGLDGVKRCKARARHLLTFLCSYVLEKDKQSLDVNKAPCDNCEGEHRYYRAAWLAPLLRRSWVPLGDNKQSPGTADAIAQLFETDTEGLRILTSNNWRNLLNALRISAADLAIRALAPNEEKRCELVETCSTIYEAVNRDIQKVREIADEIRNHPDVLDVIHNRRKRRELIHRNQRIGEQVEVMLIEIVKELAILQRLTVSRQRVGRDLDIEFEQDFVDDDEEVLFNVEYESHRFLIEVKATFGDEVRMTVSQAESAARNENRYCLCVIRLTNDAEVTQELVRSRCRFVTSIGTLIKPALEHFHSFDQARTDACQQSGDIKLVVFGKNQIRFAMDAGIADTGMTVENAVQYIAKKLNSTELGG